MSKKLFLTDVKTLRRQARQHMDEGTVTGRLLRDRETVLKLLKDALATEIVCVLHYRRHHFMARDLCTKNMADEFLDHASENKSMPTGSPNASSSWEAIRTSRLRV